MLYVVVNDSEEEKQVFEQPLVNASDNNLSSPPRVDKGKVVTVVDSTQPCRFKPTRFMASSRRFEGKAITQTEGFKAKVPSSLEVLDPRYHLEAMMVIHVQARESILERKVIDPSKAWDPFMCMGEPESILLDREEVRLRVIESILLPHDRHYLNYTSKSASDMSRKMFQNLELVNVLVV